MESLITLIKDNYLLTKGLVIVIGYFLTFFITTLLVKKIILKNKKEVDINKDGTVDSEDEQLKKDGFIIGKCENIIILSFVLAGEITGLALIFAAKSLVRQKDIQKNAGFFLAGTLVNFTASLILAYGLKFIIAHLPYY